MMTRIVSLVMLVSLFSCTQSNKLHFSSNIQTERIQLDNETYTILKNTKEYIQNCLKSNPNINISPQNILNSQNINAINDQDICRKIVKRSKSISFLKSINPNENFKSVLLVCIDREGNTVLSKLVESSQDLSLKDVHVLEEKLINNKYEKSQTAECLACGKYQILMESIKGLK